MEFISVKQLSNTGIDPWWLSDLFLGFITMLLSIWRTSFRYITMHGSPKNQRTSSATQGWSSSLPNQITTGSLMVLSWSLASCSLRFFGISWAADSCDSGFIISISRTDGYEKDEIPSQTWSIYNRRCLLWNESHMSHPYWWCWSLM
jgi:hypothetical protein